ncbi:MAG TPA: hypothetical protein EYG95_03410 [Campylobacterales bacterium]|nr:hypothetical protein [Campylobacterales bacterium]
MSQKQSLLFFVAAFIILFMVYMMGNNAKQLYFSEKENLESFSKEAKSLSALKSKFGDKKNIDRTIKTLNRIARASKDFKKSDVRVLFYESLTTSTLGNLVRKIGNSTLNIKKLEINRINETSATLRLEIKK